MEKSPAAPNFLLTSRMELSFWLIAALLALAFLLTLYRPSAVEGFAVAAVDPTRMPACAARSPAAQSLLARFASVPESDPAALELRLLLSKLCCMEADITTPTGGPFRTQALQFRTSHDMDTASSFVGRCLRNAVRQRDIDLVIEKFETRGKELVTQVLGDCTDGQKEFADVLATTRLAMTSVCLKEQPVMDRPVGARDLGFWEPETVADLPQYAGISAEAK